MNHLMLDLESLGKGPRAPIAAIGAVFFEPSTGRTGAKFYARVDFASDMSYGAMPDAETMKWWLMQDAQARAELVADGALSLPQALCDLDKFIINNQVPLDKKHLKVWGNGAAFDCVILRAAYERAGLPPPWNFWNDLDVRTVVEMGRALGFNPKHDLPFQGTKHNAQDDAFHQATYVSSIWQQLTADKEPML